MNDRPAHLHTFENWLHRLSFGQKKRAEAWEMLANLVQQNNELGEALATMSTIYTQRRDKSVAHIMLRLRESLATANFAETAAYWSPGAETILFASYGSADTQRIFKGAAKIAMNEAKIATAIREAVFMPTVIGIGLLGLLYYLGVGLFPIFETITDRSEWPALSRFIVSTSYTIRDYWFLIVPALIAVAMSLRWLIPNWRGKGRVFADRLPPFSFYKLRTGSAFLLAVVEQGKMGAAINSGLLEQLAKHQPPYVRSRIMKIHALVSTTNLGNAALRARQGFPNDEQSTVIAAYSRGDNWIPAYAEFLERSIEAVEKQVARSSRYLNLAMMTVAAIVLAGTGSTIFSITNTIN